MSESAIKIRPQSRKMWRFIRLNIWTPISAILLTFLFIGLVLVVIQKDPLIAFRAILVGAFGSQNAIAEVLVKTSPLLLAGLGTAFAFRCQIWNIGAEGQLLIGAMAASFVSLFLPGLPGILGLFTAILAAFMAGGIWAALAGILKVKLGASEIINTIMLNYVAVYLISFLVRGPLMDAASYVPQSPMFSPQFALPSILPPTRLHLGIVLAILAAGIIYLVLWKTTLGFNIIAVGSNARAARVGGISVATNMIAAMVISGGLAGLAGANEVLGLHHRLLDGVSAGYGFSAMTVAILGNLNPVGITIYSFVFAALRVGADHMQRQMGVPSSLVYLVEGFLIVFVQGRYILPRLLARIRPGEKQLKTRQEA